MINKEELNKLYYYIIPYKFNDKTVRVYRSKQTGEFVFYYDTQEGMQLVDVEAEKILTRFFTTDPEVMYGLTVDDAQEVKKKGLFKKEYKKTETVVKENYEGHTEISYKIQINSDKKQKVKKPVSIVIETFKDNDVKDGITEEKVNSLKNLMKESLEENFERLLSLGVKEELCIKIFEKMHHVTIDCTKEPSDEYVLALFQPLISTVQLYYVDENLNQDGTFSEDLKKKLRHELSHASTENHVISGLEKNNVNYAFNEMFTEFVAGKNEKGEYTGYVEGMKYFHQLFDEKPPLEMIEAYLENDVDKFYESFANTFDCSKDDAIKFSMTLDATFHILGRDKVGMQNRSVAPIYYENVQRQIILFRLKQLDKQGVELSEETITKLSKTMGVEPEKVVGQIGNVLLSKTPENMFVEGQKERLIDQVIKLGETYKSGIGNSIQEVFERTLNILASNEKTTEQDKKLTDQGTMDIGKLDLDMSIYFIKGLSEQYKLENFDKLKDVLDKKSLDYLYSSLTTLKDENGQKKLQELCENDKDLRKGVVKQALTGSMGAKRMREEGYMVSLFKSLDDKEKSDIFAEIFLRNKQIGDKGLEVQSAISTRMLQNINYGTKGNETNFPANIIPELFECVTKQGTELMVRQLVDDMNTAGIFNDKSLNEIFKGYYGEETSLLGTQAQMYEKACKNILGDKWESNTEYKEKIEAMRYKEKLFDKNREMISKIYGYDTIPQECEEIVDNNIAKIMDFASKRKEIGHCAWLDILDEIKQGENLGKEELTQKKVELVDKMLKDKHFVDGVGKDFVYGDLDKYVNLARKLKYQQEDVQNKVDVIDEIIFNNVFFTDERCKEFYEANKEEVHNVIIGSPEKKSCAIELFDKNQELLNNMLGPKNQYKANYFDNKTNIVSYIFKNDKDLFGEEVVEIYKDIKENPTKYGAEELREKKAFIIDKIVENKDKISAFGRAMMGEKEFNELLNVVAFEKNPLSVHLREQFGMINSEPAKVSKSEIENIKAEIINFIVSREDFKEGFGKHLYENSKEDFDKLISFDEDMKYIISDVIQIKLQERIETKETKHEEDITKKQTKTNTMEKGGN